MTGLCHCGIAVVVCVGRKGVRCLLSAVDSSCVVVCVFQCGVRIVLLWRVVRVEWRWCVRACGLVACLPLLSVFLFSLFSSSSLCLLVFGVVRAQLCEHARYPRTPLRLPCCALSSPLPAFLCATSFLLLWNGGGGDSPCVGVLCWHDGYG